MDDNSPCWWSLTLETRSEQRESLEAVLYAAGCSGIWERGEGAAGAGEESSRIRLTVYFPGPAPTAPEALEWWPRAAGLVNALPTIESVANRDWFSSWRENFSPTPLTDETLVIPAWLEPERGETRLALKIYPGQGFGTGTHETTRLAAGLIEAALADRSRRWGKIESLLDLGTGSGILAILAARRGIGRVLALDVDPDALENARENLAHNRVENRVELDLRPVEEVEERFDLVVANIIAPVLRRLVPVFPRLLKSGGRLILSGMLCGEQTAELIRLCAAEGLVCERRQELGGWSAFSCRR